MNLPHNGVNGPDAVNGAETGKNRFAAGFRRFAARFLGGSEKDAGQPAEISAKAAETAPDSNPALPTGVSPSLARILRPAAAYRWLLPPLAAITPQYIEMVLRGALAGNHVQQWELFDLMLDTWPELAACTQELRDAVMERTPIFTPFSDDDDEPTTEAVERQKVVSSALRRMRPIAAQDENALSGTISDLVDGWFRGVVVLEVDWQMVDAGKLGTIAAPRATYWVHPVCYAFDTNGRMGLRTDAPSMGGMGHVSAQPSPAQLTEFPAHKFLVGIHKAKSGTALGGALLRPLAWWWAAANFSADWLLNLAQVFGLPFRWANYDPQAPQETVDRICEMLQNMGSAGWAAFPEGTTLELKESTKTGDHSPQGELLDRADRYARLLILGQTMSGSQDASKGGGKAFGEVEGDVKEMRANAVAAYVSEVINEQLVPSIIQLNYGDCDECPEFRLAAEEEGDYSGAQRDALLAKSGLEIPVSFLRKKYGIPAPAQGEEVIGGAKAAEDAGGFDWEPEYDEEETAALEAGDGKFHGNQHTGPIDHSLPDEHWTGTRGEMAKRASAIIKSFEPAEHPVLGKVHFSKDGRGKTLSRQTSAHDFQAVQALPQLIARGKLQEGSVPDNKGRRGIKGFRTLESSLRIGKTTYKVQMLIKESTADGRNYLQHFYLHRLKHHHGPIKGRAVSPYTDPAFRLRNRGPDGPSNLAQEGLVVKLQEIASIEDDALFAKALTELADTL